MSTESAAKAQQMVDRMAGVFAQEFKTQRAGKLKDGIEYFTGEVWGGEDALSIGLVDQIGTLENAVKSQWGLPTYDFGPKSPASGVFPFTSETFAALLTRASQFFYTESQAF
jgi:ClpP class serine protease